MPAFKVINVAEFGSKRWRRFSSLSFTQRDMAAPLVLSELSRAQRNLPIAFAAQEGGYVPVALLGLRAGENLLLGPDGNWRGDYIPAVYRSYPFALTRTNDGRGALCYDTSSGLLSDDDGEPFFDDSGAPSTAVRDIADFLGKLHAARQRTQQCCELLSKHELIAPWAAQIKLPSGERTLENVFQIDEKALQRLPATALAELRDAGGLVLSYCQLLSMQNLGMLALLADQQASQTAAPTMPGSIDELLGGKDEVLSFDF